MREFQNKSMSFSAWVSLFFPLCGCKLEWSTKKQNTWFSAYPPHFMAHFFFKKISTACRKEVQISKGAMRLGTNAQICQHYFLPHHFCVPAISFPFHQHIQFVFILPEGKQHTLPSPPFHWCKHSGSCLENEPIPASPSLGIDRACCSQWLWWNIIWQLVLKSRGWAKAISSFSSPAFILVWFIHIGTLYSLLSFVLVAIALKCSDLIAPIILDTKQWRWMWRHWKITHCLYSIFKWSYLLLLKAICPWYLSDTLMAHLGTGAFGFGFSFISEQMRFSRYCRRRSREEREDCDGPIKWANSKDFVGFMWSISHLAKRELYIPKLADPVSAMCCTACLHGLIILYCELPHLWQ